MLAIALFKTFTIDNNAMKTFKALLQDKYCPTDINFLVVGRTGHGKSTLINSLLEIQVAPEGEDTDSCTASSQSYTYPNIVPGINVTIIDTPGLQDSQDKELYYIQGMKNNCHEASLVLYCVKMTNHRLTNDDKVAMQKLYQVFGRKFWDRVVFVLTFANDEKLKKWDKRDLDDKDHEPLNDDKAAWEKLKRKRLADRVQHRKGKLNEIVAKHLQLHEAQRESQDASQNVIMIEALPAGYWDPEYDNIPSGVNWREDLLATCYNEVKVKHKFSKLKLNKSK